MRPLDFLVLVCVLRVVSFCWFKGDLWPFPELRATAQAYEGQEVMSNLARLLTLNGGLWTGLLCPYCAPHHFGTLLAVIPLAYRNSPSWWFVPLAIGYGWAAAEIIWILDELLPAHASYYRKEDLS